MPMQTKWLVNASLPLRRQFCESSTDAQLKHTANAPRNASCIWWEKLHDSLRAVLITKQKESQDCCSVSIHNPTVLTSHPHQPLTWSRASLALTAHPSMPSPIPLLLPLLVTLLLTRPIHAAPPPPLTPIIPGRQTYNLTCPALPPPLRRGDPNSCIEVIFRQLLTLQPTSGHGFPFTTNPADAPRPEYTIPFTFPRDIPGLPKGLVADDTTVMLGNDSGIVAKGAVATRSPRHRRSSSTTTNAAGMESTGSSSQCFVRFDFWDREAGGPRYQHEEGWGMNLVTRYAGVGWDGCLRDQGGEGEGVGRVVPKPDSATLRLVIEVLAVEVDD